MKAKTYLTLFFTMLRLSAFTFGGGYVIVPLMKRDFVDRLELLTEKEMLDYTAVAQSAPGAVAVNAAILVGMKVGGIIGAAVSLVATILPPLVMLSLVTVLYGFIAESVIVAAVLRGMRAGICALIADAVISLISTLSKNFKRSSALEWLRMSLIVISFAAVFIFKINSALVVLAGALIGVAVALLTRKAGDRK